MALNLVKQLTDEFDYYRVPVNATTIELWVEELEGVPLETVERGIKNCRKDVGRKGPPTPWEIRDKASVRYPESKIEEEPISYDTLDRILALHGVKSLADMIKPVPK